MLASGNYVQWKSRIKRYIDTKLTVNSSTIVSKIHHTRINGLRRQFQLLKITISTPQLMLVRMHVKCGKPLKVENKDRNSLQKQRKRIVTSLLLLMIQKPATVTEMREMSKEKGDWTKLMALISLSFKKIYKPTNNNLRTSSNTSRANQDNSPRINRGTGYDNQRAVNVVGARENVGNVQKPKRGKGVPAYHKEKMLLCKQEEAGVQLNAEQADWKDDTDDESDDQELEAHYMYMAQIQEVQNNNDNYNVFAMENEHPEQPESSNDIYLAEHGDTNITIDSLDICYDRAQDD
ncbi:hypothetical protein Tco_0758364 [Tanacetum coccineum]